MKAFILVFCIVLITIVIAQNTDVVTVQFLFWKLELSLLVLTVLTLALGTIVGAVGIKILSGGRGARRK